MEDIPEQEGQNWIEYYTARIIDLQNAQEYERALTLVDNGLAIWSDNPYFLYLKSTILLDLERPCEAISILTHTRDNIPFDTRISDSLGENLMYQGYYHAALYSLRHFDLMTISSAGASKITTGLCNVFIGDPEPAQEFCDDLIEAHSADTDAEKFLATIRALKVLCLLLNGEEEEAHVLVDMIAPQFPDSPLVAYAAGTMARTAGDYTTAESFLRKACQVQPLDMRAKSELADLLIEMGNIEEARDIKSHITGFFGSAEQDSFPQLRGEELLLTGRYPEAVEFLSPIVEKSPDNQDIIILFISALILNGEHERAMEYADRVENLPSAWKGVYLKAAALYQAGRTIEAMRCIIAAGVRDRGNFLYVLFHMQREGYFKDPESESADSMVLSVMLRDGFFSAIPLLSTLVSANPDVLEYTALLTLLCAFDRRNAEAAIFSKKLIGSDNLDFCLVRILGLRSAGCIKDAEQEAESILKGYPDYIPALNMYARVLLENEKYREAYALLLSHKPSPGPDANLMDVLARCLVRAGEYHDAALIAFSILMQNPKRPLNYSLLGRIFMLDGNFNAALYAFREDFISGGPSPDKVVLYGKALLQTRNAKEAVSVLRSFKKDLPDSPEVRYLKTAASILSGEGDQNVSVSEYADGVFEADKGVLRGYIGEYPLAARMLAMEIQMDPSDIFLRVAYAAILFELEHFSEGMQQLSFAEEQYGDDEQVQSLIKKGLSVLCFESSIEDLVRIGGEDPARQAELVHERAARLKKSGIKIPAIKACLHLTGMKANDPATRRRVADAFHMLGDLEEDDHRYEQALSVYDDLLSQYPDNAEYLAEKGLILDNLERFIDAEKVLFRALTLDPESGLACSAMCWCLSNQGKHNEALDYGNRAILISPDDWGAWNNRGLTKLGLGDYRGAEFDFRQAVRCSPEEKIARRNLCFTLINMEDRDATEVYGSLLVRFGKNVFSEEEEENQYNPPSRGRIPGTVAGYMDGYW